MTHYRPCAISHQPSAIVVDVHRQRDRNLLLERPDDPAVLLDGDDNLRRRRRILGVARAAALHEERTAVPAADVEHRGNALVQPELRLLPVECLIGLEVAAPASAASRFGLLRELHELRIGIAVAWRLEMRWH